MRIADLISPVYAGHQRALHAMPQGYGGKGDKWARGVLDVIAEYQCSSVLDYGCGQGSLGHKLRQWVGAAVRVDEYDPAVPGKDSLPLFADLVVCTDVLEHVEPERLSAVLAHLKLLARKAVFVVIATRPSNKTLGDGRNAHLIIEQDDWWIATMTKAGFAIHPGPVSPLDKPSREWVAVLTCAS